MSKPYTSLNSFQDHAFLRRLPKEANYNGKMKNIFYILGLLFVTLPLQAYHLFENSVRLDPTPEQLRPIVQINGCTAFFVENKDNKLFIASARHCFDYDAEQACTDNKIPFKTLGGAGPVGKCESIVVQKNDWVIFKVRFEPAGELTVRERYKTLRLAEFEPQIGTPLIAIGYPADTERRQRATLTSSCNYIKPTRLAWEEEFTPEEKRAIDEGGRNRNRYKDLLVHEVRSNSRLGFHNCSIWGGNSGGPMMIAGTDIVVGLPGTYMPAVPKHIFKKDSAGWIDLSIGFVDSVREKLEAAGITLVSD